MGGVWSYVDNSRMCLAENCRQRPGIITPASVRAAPGRILCRQEMGGRTRTAESNTGCGVFRSKYVLCTGTDGPQRRHTLVKTSALLMAESSMASVKGILTERTSFGTFKTHADSVIIKSPTECGLVRFRCGCQWTDIL